MPYKRASTQSSLVCDRHTTDSQHEALGSRNAFFYPPYIIFIASQLLCIMHPSAEKAFTASQMVCIDGLLNFLN